MLGKYKRVQDLFVEGAVLELPDGQPVWVQVLNPFEAEDCRAAAQTARARIMLALREHGSDEEMQLRSRYAQAGREGAIEHIAEYEANRKLPQLLEELRYDPEWVERLDMAEQTDVMAREMTDAERELLVQINREYLAEVSKRIEDEKDFHVRQLESLDDEALYARYRDAWVERSGTDRMIAEYELSETYYAARACDATRVEGEWDHTGCDHTQRIFESKEEARGAVAGLLALIRQTLGEIQITVQEGKGSGSPTSSSGSSPTPSSLEGSTPSTPDGTSTAAPSTSTSPSPTP